MHCEGQLIARWDLDKTYLRTDFDSLSDLLRTAIERPDRKRTVPGAAALLRELGRDAARIHILSGSPQQMRGRIEEKLRLDRVRHDLLTLKPNLRNLGRLRFRALRDQLGYKLPNLLEARVDDQALGDPESPLWEILVGDDAEADGFVYSLYADILNGKVGASELEKVLKAGRVYRDQRERCLTALVRLRKADVVRRIFIHLDRQTSPTQFTHYGSRLIPFYNYAQPTFILARDGLLSPAGVIRVVSSLMREHRFSARALGRSYLDLRRRGHTDGGLAALLHSAVVHQQSASMPRPEQLVQLCDELRLAEEESVSHPTSDRPRTYLELAAHHQGGRNRRKPGTWDRH